MRRLSKVLAGLLTLQIACAPLAQADVAWVVARNVRLLSEPPPNGTRLKTLHKLDRITQVGTTSSGDYIQVRDSTGVVGWVYQPFLTQAGGGATPPTPGTGAGALGPLGLDEMRAHFIDVGQGASTLLEFSCGAILVDTGGEKNALFDGQQKLQDYLTAFFARRTDLHNTLDLVVLSHPHKDHTYGVQTVLDNFTVRNVVDNGQTTGSGGPQQVNLENYAQQTSGVGYKDVELSQINKTSGLTSAVIDPIQCTGTNPLIRVLWGHVDSNLGWSATTLKNANNNSVVVRVDFGQASFLLPGDLEDVAMPALVQRYAASGLLDVDVYEVDHHGSRNGVSEDLLNAVSPQMAIISMGKPDRQLSWTAWDYGHPNKDTVDLLAQHVTDTRAVIHESLGDGKQNFVSNQPIQKAIYATGWDGTVVVAARADGSLSVAH